MSARHEKAGLKGTVQAKPAKIKKATGDRSGFNVLDMIVSDKKTDCRSTSHIPIIADKTQLPLHNQLNSSVKYEH